MTKMTSDLCVVGDVIRFTAPYDGATSDYEVVDLAKEDSEAWGRPMVFVRGCQGEPHIGLLYGEKSAYSGYWSVVSK